MVFGHGGSPLSQSRAVAGGTGRLLLGLTVAKPLEFALYLFLARSLGVEEFGRYMFALSFTLLFSVLADLGLIPVFAREVARAPQRARGLLRNALTVKLVLGILTVGVALGVSAATRAPARTVLLVGVFAVSLVINSGALLFEALLKSVGRPGTAGLSVAFQSATALAVGAALVWGGLGALGGACARLVASVAHLLIAAALCRDLLKSGESPAASTGREIRDLLRESLPLAISGAFIALYFRVDSVMLQAMQGERAVGLYGSVYRFFEAFMVVSAAYRSVVYPLMSRAADGPHQALAALCRKSLRVLLVFTIGVAVFFSFGSSTVVTWLFGAPYASAAPALVILLWALPGAFMADTLLHVLTAQRRQVAGTYVTAAVVAFNVGLNLVLIPRFSFVGAAWATAASETLCFTLLLLVVHRRLPNVNLARTAWPVVLAGGAAAMALAAARPWVSSQPIGLLVMAAVAGTVYLASLVVLKVVGREEARLLLDFVGARAGIARRMDLVFRDLVVNGLGGWPVWPGAVRRMIYRAYGMEIQTGGISPGCFFGSPRIAIGSGTTVNYRCFFDSLAAIRIGRDCAIGMEVLFCTSTHELGPSERRAGPPTGLPITVGDGCWVGGRVVILPGVTIANGCVVAGGSVVTRDCSSNGLYAGVPARRVRDLPSRSVDQAREPEARCA